jgi:hypothetical protein
MFPFRPPGPAKRATSPPTPGRVDGFASHPTMKRASGAGKERRYLDGYATRQKTSETKTSGAGRAAAEYWPDGRGHAARRKPSVVLRALSSARVFIRCSVKSTSVDPSRRPQGLARAVMGSSVTGGVARLIDARAIVLLDGLSATIRIQLSAFRQVRTRWKPVSSSQGAPFRRTACRSSIRIRLPVREAGPDGMGSVSSAYALAAAGVAVGGHGADLRKSVGGYRPHFPVKESMQFRRRAFFRRRQRLPTMERHEGTMTWTTSLV